MLQQIIFLAALLSAANAELTIGTEFVLAFPCFESPWLPSVLVVNSNSNEALVSVTSSAAGFTTMEKTVAANSALQINVTVLHYIHLEYGVCMTNNISHQGFKVRASVPVALYVYVALEDGRYAKQFMVLPTNLLDSQYLFGKQPNFGYNGAIIVATQNGTQLKKVGQADIILNELDVFLPDDGAQITSVSAPFAYITTHWMGPVMILPDSFASTHATIYPHPTNTFFTILAFEDNTKVSVNGKSNVTVNAGDPYYTNVYNGGSVVASKPVQVWSYNPVSQYGNVRDTFLFGNVQFYTFGTKYTPTLVIITPLSSTGNILLDGRAIPALQYRHIQFSQDYYYTQNITGPAMLHTVSTTVPGDRYLLYIDHHTDFNVNDEIQISGLCPIALNLNRAS